MDYDSGIGRLLQYSPPITDALNRGVNLLVGEQNNPAVQIAALAIYAVITRASINLITLGSLMHNGWGLIEAASEGGSLINRAIQVKTTEQKDAALGHDVEKTLLKVYQRIVYMSMDVGFLFTPSWVKTVACIVFSFKSDCSNEYYQQITEFLQLSNRPLQRSAHYPRAG